MATVFELLDAEWHQHLARNGHAARRVPEVCALAGNARTPGDIEGFVRSADPPTADRILVGLVRRAVEDDPLAARVLLQLLLPGTRRLAQRWWAVGDADERAAAAVCAVYGRIRTYPLARRPARIAANILMDAANDMRRVVPTTITIPHPDTADHLGPPNTTPTFGDYGMPHPADELAEVLRDAADAGTIATRDARLIAQSRIAGQRIADIARQHGLRPRTLWDRRQRAEQALMANQACHPAALTE